MRAQPTLMVSKFDPRIWSLRTTDGGNVLVESRGVTGDRLVFVHGMGATRRTWQRVLAGFERPESQLIAYDQRGHGGSRAGTMRFRFTRLVTDLEELLAGNDNGAPTTLVGHSMGAAVVMAYLAWRKPAGVVGAILANPVMAAPRGPVEKAAAQFAASPLADRMLNMGWGRRLVLGSLLGPDADAIAREIVVSDMHKAVARREVTAGLDGLDLGGCLSDVTVPVRLVSGAVDRAIAVSKVHHMAAGLPDASVRIVERCGHYLPLEQPRAVLEEIAALHADRH